MKRLAILLGVVAVGWPAVLAGALVDRLDGAPSAATVALYAGCAAICHQRPERSFSTGGFQWPVCARCAGLYLAGPFGALAALAARRRRRPARLMPVLMAAGLPTALTVLVEWTAPGVITSVHRALAALPLGAALAFFVVSTAAEAPPLNRVH